MPQVLSKNIRCLHLIHSFSISSTGIYQILEELVQIKELKVNQGKVTFYVHQTPNKGLEYLQYCRNKLEILDWPQEIHHHSQIRELAEFTVLKSATICLCSLFTEAEIKYKSGIIWESWTSNLVESDLIVCFPKSIEEVSFVQCVWDNFRWDESYTTDIEAIATFGLYATTFLPKVKQIKYICSHDRYHGVEMDSPKEELSKNNIRLVKETDYNSQ